MPQDSLTLTFDPLTIEHLGVKMYSNIPSAIAELVANSYDAGASKAEVKLFDDGTTKRIEVIDNGSGMNFEDINNKFLRIGRNRRSAGFETSPDGNRKATGKKGLGKLALFGLGKSIVITTTQKGSNTAIRFTLNWDDLIASGSGETISNYKPIFESIPSEIEKQGTTISLSSIKRKTAFDSESLALSLSRLFNFFNSNFKCLVSLNDETPVEVSNTLKYKNMTKDFTWRLPTPFATQVNSDYEQKEGVIGEIYTSPKPLRAGMKGVTLFANGRMVNAPEFFVDSESSHFYTYVTGYLNVDFVDNINEDVISTNRQSLDWENENIQKLQKYLRKLMLAIHADWRSKRESKKKNQVKKSTGVDTEAWYKTLPSNIENQLKPVVQSLINDSELPDEKQIEAVTALHNIIPEYPYYHWRNLHHEVSDIAKKYYVDKDYYTALLESVKRYTKKIRTHAKEESKKHTQDQNLMGGVFGQEDANFFKTTEKYIRPDGSAFSDDTKNQIEQAQKHLSLGVIAGFRNPLSHEEIADLADSSLFSEKDCLDALSLMSHLFKRLDDAIEAKEADSSTESA